MSTKSTLLRIQRVAHRDHNYVTPYYIVEKLISTSDPHDVQIKK